MTVSVILSISFIMKY